ncbi:transmembrane protein 65 isoform X2 [Uranotaenia lowii]|uniref:transmembrane protein 65 isoform X2 n=1 Tax=Uranotaenia lowii TaxID=190385 RepID=UPI00247A1A0F|nr:transmembrane protein 65 isoform X2 [Uranotaenia lowii]
MSASATSLLRGFTFVFNQCSTSGASRLASVPVCFGDRMQNTPRSSNSIRSYSGAKASSSSMSRSTTCRSRSSFNLNGRRSYTQAASTLTREQLHDLVYRLNEDERELLMNTLKQFESNKQKAQFEAETMPPPPTRDLFQLGLVNALPFIGFGFLDNFTMIIAGDYIEHTLGLFMCISTMAAAALGNTISDVVGIGSAFYVEKIAEMSGVRPPKLSPLQLEMKSSRRAANMGRVLGITIGCLLGMCPLMFMKDEDKDKDKEKDDDKAKDGKEPTATETK